MNHQPNSWQIKHMLSEEEHSRSQFFLPQTSLISILQKLSPYLLWGKAIRPLALKPPFTLQMNSIVSVNYSPRTVRDSMCSANSAGSHHVGLSVRGLKSFSAWSR